ncbi:cytochrome c3 family protein [Shewanella mesophila]|uniref:cytochrome c3 family protein n=1 Tax=Shewanella mesophila TaxID=2864208 RepID=UPI001C654B42|nr:cytochrome c3 family protein [Shewanella mesophila]QYJ85659.1 cytochrome c3 family protein [Shewanella mesophila]
MCQISRYISILLYVAMTTCLWYGIPTPSIAADNATRSNTCMKCHKRNGQLLGIHANPGLAIQCQDCHGEKGNHPKKGSPINTFGADSQMPVDVQVAICLTCHDHQALAEVEWTHNVHATKLACAQCHQLHPESDPMLTLDSKQHSQLCVTCHRVNQ